MVLINNYLMCNLIILTTQQLLWQLNNLFGLLKFAKHVVQSNNNDIDNQDTSREQQQEDPQNVLLAPIQVLTRLSSVEYIFSEECKKPICGKLSIQEGRYTCIIVQDDEKDLFTMPAEDLCTLFEIPKPTYKLYSGKMFS
eukprot:UN05567